jgi:hypothetical protein
MTLEELLPALKSLSRADKLRATQFLVFELAKEEDALLVPEVAYPVWTPHHALDAAQTLLSVFQAHAGD